MIHNICISPIVLCTMYKRDILIKSGGPNAFLLFPREDYSRTEISIAPIATYPLAVIWNMHYLDHRSRSPQCLHYCTITIWIKFIREWVRNWGNYHTMRSVTIHIWSNIHPIFSSQPSSSTNMAKAHNKCIIEFDPQYSTRRSNTDLLWWQIIVA